MIESNRKTVKDRERLIQQGKGREIERRLERDKKKQETEKITGEQRWTVRETEGDKKEEEQEKWELTQSEQAVVRMYNIQQIYCPNYLSI